jgi:hypothetical protein
VRRIARYPFRLLPDGLRRVVRRQLRRWERKGTEIRVNPRVPVPPGNVIPKEERGGLDHVGIVLPPGTDQRAAVDRIAALQAADRDFAPLIVTFDDDLARIRELRYAVELLVPEEVWNAEPQRRSWSSYVRDRLQMIGATYELDRMVTIAEVGGSRPARGARRRDPQARPPLITRGGQSVRKAPGLLAVRVRSRPSTFRSASSRRACASASQVLPPWRWSTTSRLWVP